MISTDARVTFLHVEVRNQLAAIEDGLARRVDPGEGLVLRARLRECLARLEGLLFAFELLAADDVQQCSVSAAHLAAERLGIDLAGLRRRVTCWG